jgi:hypothetical protein
MLGHSGSVVIARRGATTAQEAAGLSISRERRLVTREIAISTFFKEKQFRATVSSNLWIETTFHASRGFQAKLSNERRSPAIRAPGIHVR